MEPVVVESGERFVKNHSHSHQPAWFTAVAIKGNEERERSNQSLVEPDVQVALVAGFPGKAKPQGFDITQPAVNEFGTTPARSRGEILGFDKCDLHTA